MKGIKPPSNQEIKLFIAVALTFKETAILVNPCNFQTGLKKDHSSFRFILLNPEKIDVLERTIIFHRLAVKSGQHL